MGRAKRIWYLSPMRAAKVQASLRIRAVSPEPSLLAHTSSESRGTFRQKARSLAPLNGWACAVKVCHDGMLEDTKSLGAAQIYFSTFASNYFKQLLLLTTPLMAMCSIFAKHVQSAVLGDHRTTAIVTCCIHDVLVLQSYHLLWFCRFRLPSSFGLKK